VLDNDDGTQFVNVYYAGPIRSAGGTAQALSVLVADYARALLGIDQYKARDEEINRYAEEIDLYDKETGLQYSPKEKESKFIAENMPIMLDGEATGDEEVSGSGTSTASTPTLPAAGCVWSPRRVSRSRPRRSSATREIWTRSTGRGSRTSSTAPSARTREGEADDGADAEDGRTARNRPRATNRKTATLTTTPLRPASTPPRSTFGT